MRQVTIIKGSHVFIYRVDKGEEKLFLKTLIEHVKKARIDWFDAMTLSFDLGIDVSYLIHAMSAKS